MKTRILTLLSGGALMTGGWADTLLWSDNFDVADNGNFDAASVEGRRSGLVAEETRLRSWGHQQDISNNQLLLPSTGNNGVRFDTEPGPYGATNRYDWAAGGAGTIILDNENFVVSFDWIPPGDTSTSWISFQVGTINADSGNLTNDDYGILFRQNGGVQSFANGGGGVTGTPFTPAAVGVTRKVRIQYIFDSFADGTTVRAISSVDGMEVEDLNFVWDSNSGEMRMELGNNDPGNRVDNLTVSRVDPLSIDNTVFSSGDAPGDAVGTLTEAIGGLPMAATFALVSGTGDDDNGKFQISGDQLQLGTYDFTGAGSTEGQEFFVRVQATDDGSAETVDLEIVLTIVKDDDVDGILDAFEIANTGNITDLNGLAAGPGPGVGTGDLDGDGLIDLDEYNLILTTYPGLDITNADTDGDTLEDGPELAGVGSRPATDPTLADTDGDGLDDFVESNTTTFVSATNTGSNPTVVDTDGDGLDDLFETTNAPPYDPNTDNSGDDFDGDSLDVATELAFGSDVLLPDTDGDTLDDGVEFNGSANPYRAGDPLGVPTGVPGEQTNPTLVDSDADGINDDEEVVEGSDTFVTNPNLADTDGDGAADGDEVAWGGPYSPVVDNSLDGDTDGDTLNFAEEVAAGTNPTLADTDTDGLNDFDELYPFYPRSQTNPLEPDSDFDGLSDLVETNTEIYVDPNDTGTDGANQDTDFDGARDGYELANGTDPLDISSNPPPMGAGISVAQITDESLTGISTTKTYTHAISGGTAAVTINGVDFDNLAPAVVPDDFTWDTFANNQSAITGNNNNWVPADGNVTGQGLLDLLGSFSYSGNGAYYGSAQRYTLSGLTPGEDYIFRFYIRAWDSAGSGRPHDLTFTNGAQVVTPFMALAEDRPGVVLGTGNQHDAYYLEFAYQAQGTELVIDAPIPQGAYGTDGDSTSGSFHVYGLTNEVAGAAVYAVGATGGDFKSGAAIGAPVATLGGYLDAVPETSTFALVAGTGDDDNGLFQVSGDEIQVNTDFTGANSVDGQQFSVRVRGTDTATGALTADLVVILTVSKDDDLDDLPDDYELFWAGDLATLSGLGAADADSDNLYDLEEYQLSIGAIEGLPTYATIDPTDPDTDDDGLNDGDEVWGSGLRPPTDPLLADTDGDGLGDLEESNTGTFVDGNDTGTSPLATDTDFDTVPDGVEVANGSDPNDPDDFIPAALTVTEITSDASSGIDSSKTYTHLISGGNSATVNGVIFEALTPTSAPFGFDWTANGAVENQVLNNLGGWNSTAVGLNGTGIEQLLDSFVYSSGTPGVTQTFTFSNLTVGETYEWRLYIRVWDAAGVRPFEMVITNGAEVFDPMLSIPEDQPGVVLGNGNNDSAYYIGYEYTAATSSLVVEMTVPDPANGGFHMYAMSNEVFAAEEAGPVITNVTRTAGGDLVLDFEGKAATFYDVTKSATLPGTFVPLDIPLTVLTNGAGIGQAIVPASEASEPSEFYRIEE